MKPFHISRRNLLRQATVAAGGTMTDWGAHHHDIALWGAGYERSGPVSIEGKRLIEPIAGGYDAPSQYEVHYEYPNGGISQNGVGHLFVVHRSLPVCCAKPAESVSSQR